MAEGTVRWFNTERGYGFIVPDGGFGEVRVHYSEIQTNGYKTLDVGERVSFDIVAGPDGPRAVTVTPLGESVPVFGVHLGDPPAVPPAPRARRPVGRGVLIGLLVVLMLGCFVTFVVMGMVQGEELGAVFLVLFFGFGWLLSKVEGS
ncbi:MAG: hypothetical protein GEV11_13145 [Streptosporangiales bacterium]|nr:hypothetical protein [Streptosporangiales bacterium]